MRSAGVSTIVSVRVTAEERVLLESAAAGSRTNLSDFIRRHAVDAAEAEVLERRVVTIPAADWERFEAWAARPAETIPQLTELAKRLPLRDR